MKMVFVGNCQIAVLFELFRLFSETALDDQMRYLPSYENLSAEGQKDLQQADVIVEQILDLGPRVNVEDHNQHARRVLVPLVACGFLWPFAGQAHPKNTSFGFLPSGPYNAELGDSYLNRLIAAGVEAESAVQQYEGVNINRRVNLDRLREIWIDRQRSRDEICGFNIADHITEHYKLEQLFRTPHHPGLRISRNLFEQAFNHIGASSSDTTRMLASLNRSPFPYDSTPFHPFVVDHFGSEFVGRNQRHPFLTEGTFTFREYAIRYMRFEWNRDLAEGIATAGHADPGLCEAQLRRALEISPGSPTGHFALGKVLAKQERHDEAESQLRHAIALADENDQAYFLLGEVLKDHGTFEEAEAAFRAAIERKPTAPHYVFVLASMLRGLGRHQDAANAIESACSWLPYYAPLREHQAEILRAAGDMEAAERAWHIAAALKARAAKAVT